MVLEVIGDWARTLSAPLPRSKFAGLAICLVVLALLRKRRLSRRRGPIEDLSKVGRRADEEHVHDELAEYDVVIVGGGTAGCVIASRLSEDPKIKVLLLESGKSSNSVLFTRIPAASGLLFGKDPHMYNLYTTPQQHAGNQRLYWPRAKMLGGCSAINAQIFHYGDPADYDEWAKLGGPGAESYAYKDFRKYFMKFERFTPSKIHPEVLPADRGASGLVNVGFHGNDSLITQCFIKACQQIGIPRVPDLNTMKGSKGVAKFSLLTYNLSVTYIDAKGRRVTTENSYLTPDVLGRPNLTVAVGASVTKILFDAAQGGQEPRAVGVEFCTSSDSPRFRVRARKEVVLSAGAIHTPQIMMLSGLGPAAELEKHDIATVADLPGVGAHLMDHIVTNACFKDTSGSSLVVLRPRNVKEFLRALPHLARYILMGKGGLTCNIAEAGAFVRSDDKAFFGDSSPIPEDTTSGPSAPDLEMLVTPMGYSNHGLAETPLADSLGLHMTLLRPTSTGSITLKSKNPFEHPLIEPNYLVTAHDRDVLLRGMRLLLRTAEAKALSDIIDSNPTTPDARWSHTLATAPDEEVREYIAHNTQTLYHPTSTARMAPLADGGVCDPRLKVYGVRGLRIADASVFPTIVSGHTAGPVIAIAEKAADMIKADLAGQKF
ncbi:GMC oxidoreductase [Peniophora sp. CONT]|nr:GMC oxidoreductase [Peniophora sp. CONT]